MTDYESVYNDALNDEEVPIGALIDDIHQITHAAGLAAVVAAAKAEALKDAAAFLSEPSTTWRGPRGGRIVADSIQ